MLKHFADGPNMKTLFMPLETTGVLAAIAGIGEIAREAFGDDGPPGAAPPARRRRRQPQHVPETE